MAFEHLKRSPALIWLIWLTVFCTASAFFPRDASFDVAHYQIHNGWSALNGRFDQDFAPAEMHSFFNPIYNLVVYWLMTVLPGHAVAFLLAIPQALILPALYYLSRTMFRAAGADVDALMIGLIAFTGFLAEAQFGLFASVRNDAWGALGFIFALYLALRDSGGSKWRDLAIGSLVLGAMVGMKLTNAVYVVGYAAAILVLLPGTTERLRACLISGSAGALGIAALGAPWMLQLWSEFGNPVFPMMNGVFHSPYGPSDSFRDERYLPGGVLEGVARPFQFLFDGTLINEYHFFDARFLLAYLASAIILGVAALLHFRGEENRTRRLVAVSVGLLVSICVWTALFSIQRYMIAAWLLGPTLAVSAALLVRPDLLKRRAGVYGAIAMSAILVFSTQAAPLRRIEWRSLDEAYVWAEAPAEYTFDNSIILFSGGYPSAFSAMAFSESAVFSHAAVQDWSAPALEAYQPRIRSVLNDADKPIFAVILDFEDHIDITASRMEARKDLQVNKAGCLPLKTSFDVDAMKWVVCPVEGPAKPVP